MSVPYHSEATAISLSGIPNWQTSPPPQKIHIIGPNGSLNTSIRFLIESQIDVCCTCEECRPEGATIDGSLDAACIVLLDALGLDAEAIESRFLQQDNADAEQRRIILFNASGNGAMERIGRHQAVWGIFYQEDSTRAFLKGIQAILNGRKWLSRERASRAAGGIRGSADIAGNGPPALSVRESEILRLLSAGMNNLEIAAEVGISLHTVKTHVYHIYKKINVPNRLQAALWAATHLG